MEGLALTCVSSKSYVRNQCRAILLSIYFCLTLSHEARQIADKVRLWLWTSLYEQRVSLAESST